MTICRYWQQGNCKFGNSCRFEHPDGGNRNQPANRFGALGGGGGGGGGGGSGGGQNALDKYRINLDTIEADLTTEVPQWILSAYAPGRDAPEQLFGGYPREQSFEEMRLHYLTAKATGGDQQALNQAQELYQNAQQQMQNAVGNLREAASFVVQAENKHPNRHDICQQGTQGQPFGEFLVGRRPKANAPGAATQANPFSTGASSQPSAFGGGGAAAGVSAFGQPSALGQRANPFGQPSQQSAPTFGQPSQPSQAASPFGQSSQQPSAFGQPSQPASGFGKPSFGQPSQPSAQGSAFGQPSQPSAPGSAFGQPSQLGAKPSPFGAPSFGQPSQPNAQGAAFGQPSQPSAQGSAFGQPSELGQKPNPFASTSNTTASPFATAGSVGGSAPSPFGQPSNQANAGPSPFASASNDQSQSKPNPFGQPSQPSATTAANPFASGNTGAAQPASSPFGQQPAQQASPFGSNQPQPQQQQQPNGPFAQQSNASNPFAQNAPSNASPFGQQANNATQAPAQPKAAAAPSSNPYPPDSTRQHPPIESYSAKGMDGNLTMFRDKPVSYKNGKPGILHFDGTWQRIFFPSGPPPFNKDTALPPNEYDDKTRAQWVAFAETGTFADGVMPELPPPRDCTLWNF